MMSVRKHVGFFMVVTTLFVGQSFGNDYMMTCSRPVVSKSPRLLKLDLALPCDLSKESWCNLPGDKYPWHAVRSFVFENQGLMRRMYGEVRQLSVLRMEFNGNSIDENNSVGREFDELFKPLSATTTTTTSTSTTTTTTTSTTTTTTTIPPSPEQSSSMFYPDTMSTSEPSLVTQFASVSDTSSSDSLNPDYARSASKVNKIGDRDNLPNPEEENSRKDLQGEIGSGNNFTTATVFGFGSDSYLNGNGVQNKETNNYNVTIRTTSRNSSDSGSGSGNSNDNGSNNNPNNNVSTLLEDDYVSDVSQQQQQTTTEESGRTDGTTLFDQRVTDEGEIVMTTEGLSPILFQDADKATTVKSSSTTTLEDSDSDAPQQIHRSDIKGVNACPVKEEVVAPYWANNTRGEVLALLNLYPFEQYIHWEKCTFEHRQMYCRDGCRCEQQYRLHRLLAFDPTNECRGIFSDWFRFPSCCVCKCYLTSSDLAHERFSFNRSPRFDDTDIPDVNGVDDSHFYYKSGNFNSRQPR